jgi:dCMP deaminase
MISPEKYTEAINTKHYENTEFLDDDFLNLDIWRIIKIPYHNDKGFIYEVSSPSTNSNISVDQKDRIYLEMSNVWAKNSYCKRMQVGCLIVKNKSIISDGYNGSPTGFPNICESDDNVTLPYILHAEANAITKLAKGTQGSEGSTLYVTLSPCFECSKLIIQSGIKRVVFTEVYRNPESISFLAEAGIEILKISK